MHTSTLAHLLQRLHPGLPQTRLGHSEEQTLIVNEADPEAEPVLQTARLQVWFQSLSLDIHRLVELSPTERNHTVLREGGGGGRERERGREGGMEGGGGGGGREEEREIKSRKN